MLLEESHLPLDDVLRRYGLKIDPSFLVSSGAPKIKIRREKRAPANAAIVEDRNGPPTPPSSPDARSAAAAALVTTPGSTTDRQENAEMLPMSPPQVDGHSSTQSKRARFALKRKSRAASDINEAEESNSELAEGGAKQKNNYGSSQTNGTGDDEEKVGAERITSPTEQLPNVKRFKDEGVELNKRDNIVADSTSNDSAPAPIEGEQPLNGSHPGHAMADNGSTDINSTADGQEKKSVTKSINDNNMLISGGNGGNAGSPMIVEEPNSVNKANEGKMPNNRSSGENRRYVNVLYYGEFLKWVSYLVGSVRAQLGGVS